MHGWVLDLIRLRASHLRCDSVGKINDAEDDRPSRLSIMPIRSWVEGAGLSAPALREGTAGAQSRANSCRARFPLFPGCWPLLPSFRRLSPRGLPPPCRLFGARSGNELDALSLFSESPCCHSMFVSCPPPAVWPQLEHERCSRCWKRQEPQRFPGLWREEMRRKTLSVAGFLLAWKLVQLLR